MASKPTNACLHDEIMQIISKYTTHNLITLEELIGILELTKLNVLHATEREEDILNRTERAKETGDHLYDPNLPFGDEV